MSDAEPTLRVLSLGAGVQSTTVALMAARGLIGPALDCAIFADTESEPGAVYRHLDWLERQLPFPVYRVGAGSLHNAILAGMAGDRRMDARPPFFTAGGGMLRRQCTQDHKIIPIQRKVRELLGVAPRRRVPRGTRVEQWIGISTDEASRMRPSQLAYIDNRFPLIEAGMSRADCLAWCAEQGYPTPPKSACTFCPFHDDAQWREMRAEDPQAWAGAVAIDRAIRPGVPGPSRPEGEAWFVHRLRVPLDQIDFAASGQRASVRPFTEECGLVCGV